MYLEELGHTNKIKILAQTVKVTVGWMLGVSGGIKFNFRVRTNHVFILDNINMVWYDKKS